MTLAAESVRDGWQREPGRSGVIRATGATCSNVSRRFRITTAVGALAVGIIVFVAFGHGMRSDPMSGGHGGGHAAAALCLVLFVVLAPVTVCLVQQLVRRVATCRTADGAARASLEPSAPVAASRARASPAWLQCFRC